jgi:eukaryotic-like serine/threonine-protein kinase
MKKLIGHQISHYRIISQQGIGGMAIVYHAYDVNLERDVALKLIRSDAFAEDEYDRLMRRFEREAKAQSKFSHPNIAPVYDFGDYDGMPYLVMPYFPAGTLKDRTGQSVDIEQAFDWVISIAGALSYAHQLGVIHRDIKPSNILFTEKEEPILTDFGIAKLLEDTEGTLTETGFGVGTPEYMAPEQWQGESSAASDQYALGVVLYELLTGRKPYTAETPVAVALKQSSDPLVRPSAYVPTIPIEVEKIIYKTLAHDPKDRFEDIAAFQQALLDLGPRLAALIQERQDKIDAGEINATVITKAALQSESQTVDVLDPLSAVPKSSSTQKKPKTKSRKKLMWMVGGVAIFSLLIGLALWQFFPSIFGYLINSKKTEDDQVALVDSSPSLPVLTETLLLSTALNLTKSPTETIEPSVTVSPSATQIVIESRLREKDGMEMVYVPAGEFIFGTNRGSYSYSSVTTQLSSWDVYLDAFWVDKFEVTNRQYTLCVEAGVCSAPYRSHSNTRYGYFTDETYADYPVINVDHRMATIYCEWVGGRLPTEAEWEKAARGTDGREYPWGHYWSMDKPGNFDDYQGIDEDYDGDTMPVGSFPEGASPYGAMDMLGNVWEWVADWYHPAIFATEPVDNPTGPKYGEDHIIRGGSYFHGSSLLAREAYPSWSNWSDIEEIGFRCVMDGDT